MAIDIKFGTTSLEGARKWGDSLKSRIRKTIIPRRDGNITDDYPVIDSRDINVSGILVKSTASALRSSLDTIQLALNSGKQKLYLHDDRYIECLMSSFRIDYVKGFLGAAIKYSIKFTSEDPFWYATSSSTASNSSTISADTETALSISASTGNAKSYCTITAKPSSGTMASLKIYNSNSNIDRYWIYDGTVSSDGLLTVDSDERTVVLNSKNDLTNFSGDFWKIQGGETNILYITSDSDIASGDLTVTWTPRWF